MIAYLKRFPVWTYFVLTHVISWGGVLVVIGGLGGVPGTAQKFEALLLPVILAMLAGPSIAGVLCTWFFGGRVGLSEFRFRLLRWRVDVRWYALALLTAPLIVGVIRAGRSNPKLESVRKWKRAL
jgi:hypothetical protein